MTADPFFPTGEKLTSTSSPQDEPVADLVPEARQTFENVTALPGVQLELVIQAFPEFEDPNTSDNPALIQARNSYRMVRFRLANVHGYAGSFIEQLHDELADATVELITVGGKLAIDGSLLD